MNNFTKDSFFRLSIVCQFLALLACLIFIVTKLKLNKYIKSILAIMVILNMICLSLSFFSGFLPESWQCQITICSIVSMVFGSYTLTNVISALRFHMAKLASKSKIVKGQKIIFLISFSIVMCYGLVPSYW